MINQNSALRNMVSLRTEQIKHSVELSTRQVADDLSRHKGSNLMGSPKKGFGLPDDFSIDIFKPVTVASRFSVEEIRQKFESAFQQNDLKNIKFEFGITSFDRSNNMEFQKASPGFYDTYVDTVHNFVFIPGWKH